MRESLSRLVFPIFERAATLHARLKAGESAAIKVEQAALRDLLEPLGRPGADRPSEVPQLGPSEAGPLRPYLGTHYALVCWLDELFILDSPWSVAWNESKLETRLYSTNDRAWKFWEQAEMAEREGGLDHLEVFFLCVVFGMRGERVAEPDALSAWFDATRGVLLRQLDTDWAAPADLEPPAAVPPRYGRRRMRRVSAAGGIALVLAVPVVVALIARAVGD